MRGTHQIHTQPAAAPACGSPRGAAAPRGIPAALALAACLGVAALVACASPPHGPQVPSDPTQDVSERIPPPQPRPAADTPAGTTSPASAPIPRSEHARHAPPTAGSGAPPAPAVAKASMPSPAVGERIVAAAQAYIGVPYRRGGRDQRGIDCSGLVQAVYSRERIALPRTCEAQARVGAPIPVAQAQPGDLLFFADGPADVSHVGIYAGSGAFIHASTGAGRVRVDALDDRYFAVRLRQARRVLH